MDYRVIAISDQLAERVRATRLAPGYGHPVTAEVATGYGPCRQCLRDFEVGRDRRLLFTYDAFHGAERLPLPGPVFIHEAPCQRHPEDAGFPVDLRTHALTLEAFGRGRNLRSATHVTGPDLDSALTALLARPEVNYILVRDTGAGCFDCRIERAAT